MTDLKIGIATSFDPDEQENEYRRDEKRRRQKRIKEQCAFLDQRSQKPTGYTAMTPKTSDTPVGQLWLTLCANEGHVNCLTNSPDVSVEERERLLLIHFRMRLKGFRPEALAKLCPVSLLKKSFGKLMVAIDELPQVVLREDRRRGAEESTSSDDPRDDVRAYLQERARAALKLQLGL